MIDGRPDRDAFREVLGAALDPVRAAGHRTIRLYGEMVDLLWQRQLEAALQLEELWNELLVDERLSLLCVYRIDPLDRQAHGLLRRVTHCHARLLPGEDPERFAAAVDRAYAEVFGTSGDVATLRDLMISRLAPEPDLPAGHAALLALDEMPALLANDIRARARLHYRRAPHGRASPRR